MTAFNHLSPEDKNRIVAALNLVAKAGLQKIVKAPGGKSEFPPHEVLALQDLSRRIKLSEVTLEAIEQ